MTLEPLPLNSAPPAGALEPIGGHVTLGRRDWVRMGSAKQVTITRPSPHTGAEVLGVDLAQPLRPAVRTELAGAFTQHSVLVFAAMQNFGEVFPQHNPRFAVPECELLAHSTQPRFEYRHKWKIGDVVIWDNRCLLHKANGDYPVARSAISTVSC